MLVTRSTSDAVDWQTGLYVLSLDFIDPVYDELGVQIRQRETLKGLARDALTGLFTGYLANANASAKGEDFYSAHVLPFLESSGRVFGLPGRQCVEYWVAYIVCSEGENPWVLYEDLMSSWAANYRKTGHDEIGFSTDVITIAGEVLLAGDLSVAEATLQQQRRRILTYWDLSIFTRLGLLEIPEGSDFFPLVDGILLMIAMHRFHIFWSWLLSFIGEGDLDAIGRYAKNKFEERKIPYVAPGDLPVLAA
jgi:hypothetical protein